MFCVPNIFMVQSSGKSSLEPGSGVWLHLSIGCFDICLKRKENGEVIRTGCMCIRTDITK